MSGGFCCLEAEIITAQLIKGESGFIKAIQCFKEDFCLSGQNLQLGTQQCQEAAPSLLPPLTDPLLASALIWQL